LIRHCCGNYLEMAANRDKLLSIFKSIDINGDNVLDPTEILKAFEKYGEKPPMSDIYAMVEKVDTDKDGTVNFDEFCDMVEKVHRGELPRATGIASLIKGAWEDYIQNVNKPVEKNKVVKVGGKGGGVANNEAPQGQKFKIEKKGAKKMYDNLPQKKSLNDLP